MTEEKNVERTSEEFIREKLANGKPISFRAVIIQGQVRFYYYDPTDIGEQIDFAVSGDEVARMPFPATRNQPFDFPDGKKSRRKKQATEDDTTLRVVKEGEAEKDTENDVT